MGEGVASGAAHDSEPGRGERPAFRRDKKSDQAFRTISEVAGELDVAQHVLRFWETKFPQIKPLKRGGGRRYYRPEDLDLLRRIRALLYEEGYTIKGVQKLLRQKGGAPDGTVTGAPPPDGGGQLSPAQRREIEGVLSELESLRAAFAE